MLTCIRKRLRITCLIGLTCLTLTACSTSQPEPKVSRAPLSKTTTLHQSHLTDPARVLTLLTQRHQAWKGTRYRLGGLSKAGIDCSGFTQMTYKELFGIQLPRTTTAQSNIGRKVSQHELRPGDLVFFRTGRGPNGKHVGIYMKDGQFLHASTKGGVIYSSIHSPYWSKAYWQARRL